MNSKIHGQISLCLILLIASSVLADSDSYHKFEDASGRGIEARILDFDPHVNTVKLRLRNKRIRSVKIDIFSESSQLYIRDWYQSESLSSGKGLTLSINKKSLRSDRYHEVRNGWQSHYPGMDFEDVTYEITLLNKGKESLSNIVLEYCIYYERTIDETTFKLEEISGWGHRGTDYEELPRCNISETLIGTISIPELHIKKKLIETTKVVCLYEGTEGKYDRVALRGRKRQVDDELSGIIIQISLPLPSGGIAQKEYAYPLDFLKKEHVDWSKPIEDFADDVNDSSPPVVSEGGNLGILQQINTYMREKKFTEAERLCRQLYNGGGKYEYHGAWRLGSIYLSIENPDRNIDLGVEWMLKASGGGFAGPYSDLAKFYASDPDPSMRDGKKAVKYAAKMMKIYRKTPAPGAYETMACALARNGQYSKAVETMQKAITAMEERRGEQLPSGHGYLRKLDQFSNNQAWPN